MGSTTYNEYKGIFEKDRALVRRFQKIDIVEPSIDDTTRILAGLKHQATKSITAIRYTRKKRCGLRQNCRPSTSTSVICRIKPSTLSMKPARASGWYRHPSARKTINVTDIEEIIAKIARIPKKSVSSSEKEVLKNLDRNLKLVVYGQDESIEALASAIRLTRSGLGNEDKPVGSFLFAGPTGVGKTEISKQLAKILGVEFIRLDMSEYMEQHAVSRLIGAPPGYVGFDQGGLLTDQVIKNPHAVVLLDELEKAHHDIYNILLQVMDHGTLTDSSGRKADFRNVILIMTTNAGVWETTRKSMGFKQQNHSFDAMDEINRVFTPEFRNRLDNIIWFNHLDMAVTQQVVDKFIVELQSQLDRKGVSLELTEAAKAWFAENGYDKAMGARPMNRLIQDKLKKPLANEVLFGELCNGGSVKIDVKDNEIVFEYENKQELVAE